MIMPGIDLQKDILEMSQGRIFLPENNQIELVDQSILTGQNFQLKWENNQNTPFKLLSRL